MSGLLLRTACSLAVLGAPSAAAQSWQPVGPPVSPERVATPRVAVHRGVPVVGSTALSDASRGVVSAYLGGAWVEIGAPPAGTLHRPEWWLQLVSAPHGRLFRVSYAYYHQPSGSGGLESGLKVREYIPSSASWEPLIPAPAGSGMPPGNGAQISTGEAHVLDVEVDAQGRLVVSYQDGPGGNEPHLPQGAVTVLRIDPGPDRGSVGTVEVLGGRGFSDAFVPGGQSYAWTTNVEIGGDGTIWVAWNEYNALSVGGPHRAAVARYDEANDTWIQVGDFGLGLSGENLAMVMGPGDRPLVACPVGVPSVPGGQALQVVRATAARDGWQRYGLPCGVDDNVRISPDTRYRDKWALAVAPDGVPYLAYRGLQRGNKVCVRRLDASTFLWEPVGTLGFSPGTGLAAEDDYVSLAFRGDIPIVAFRHGVTVPGPGAPNALEVWAFH